MTDAPKPSSASIFTAVVVAGIILYGIVFADEGSGSLSGARSDYDDIEDQLKAQGWRVERTSRGHIQCFPPDKSKAIVVTSGTPGDHRAIKNFKSKLRQSGATLKGLYGA